MTNNIVSHFGQAAPMIAGAALLIFAALHDIAARTIPNFVSVLLGLLGIGLNFGSGQLGTSMLLGALVFVVCTACWLRGWMGGGDVKLLTAAALFVPPAAVGAMVVSTTMFGGVVGVIYLIARMIARRVAFIPRRPPHAILARVLRAEHWRLLRGAPLPYASAIAAGTLFVIVSG